MLAALLILEFSSDRGSFFSSKVIKDMFVDATYTRTMSLYEISDHQGYSSHLQPLSP